MTPVWLLDVDGVLNAVGYLAPEGYIRTQATTQGRTFPITYNPEVIEKLCELHENRVVRLRWLTTWCDDAEKAIAPAIGMPRNMIVEGVSYRRSRMHQWWKSPAALAVAAYDLERPVIWTDDDLDYSIAQGHVPWLKDYPNVTPLCPDPGIGLTLEIINSVEQLLRSEQVST